MTVAFDSTFKTTISEHEQSIKTDTEHLIANYICEYQTHINQNQF